MTTRVALDTSALMMPVELDVRLFDELERLLCGAPRPPESDRGSSPRDGAFEVLAPRPVVDELRRLADGGGLEGTAASVGYELATDRCLVVETDESYADDALVELAREGGADYVVTNDRPLGDRVLDANVPVIALRGRNKLTITQP
ncbi:PIN domain-containing protein [Natrononativus amylolyticus]|uniref:PIN domain-containing protein n=1 Tax=Natrononativus amylolyticus TaxID=2963434 RepID=UPI0020CB8F26|nr:DUF188 domain-containing protein [Natrononativus amylolyticus]